MEQITMQGSLTDFDGTSVEISVTVRGPRAAEVAQEVMESVEDALFVDDVPQQGAGSTISLEEALSIAASVTSPDEIEDLVRQLADHRSNQGGQQFPICPDCGTRHPR